MYLIDDIIITDNDVLNFSNK